MLLLCCIASLLRKLFVDSSVAVVCAEPVKSCADCNVLEHRDTVLVRNKDWRIVIVVGDAHLDERHVDVAHVGVLDVDG